ncbi:NUDIX domain-containing protein [Halodesulfurarchaeum sp. HSR-GB]|uniref:NUDIX domain-containing protein n=1 Tax=Halodesulfurarchaeum sp. HSR-GB TaxID=3074077 RepID=UPI002863056C|nr:NUDIX domain-containing protein [Halodesulfurarchaeum sp. HSR-GB]MDR5656609.1 NUDIX domain-containing protein [Halodesulfurarchaeum sp. HSR-GB]
MAGPTPGPAESLPVRNEYLLGPVAPPMETRSVVTVFLTNGGEVLLLRRSEAVGSYPGRWGGVAGHVEPGDAPLSAAKREIREETGLDAQAVTLVSSGEPFSVTDPDLDVEWTVHPFRFETDTRDVQSNWETTETAWVPPPAICDRETVPDLWRSWDRIRPTVEQVRADSEAGSATLSKRALEVLRDEATLIAADGGDWDDIAQVALDLRTAREAMVVLQVRVDRVMAEASEDRTPDAVRRAAIEALSRAESADRAAAELAAERVEGQTVLTLSRSGTVEQALERGSPETVWVPVSRPGREGRELASDLAEAGLDVRLTSDANIPGAVSEVDVVLLGADTLLANGDVINKVGTTAAALAGTHFDVPVSVVAATAKISPSEQPPDLTDGGADHEQLSAPESVTVVDPIFERTSAALFDGYLTEDGVLDADAISEYAANHAQAAAWKQSLTGPSANDGPGRQ